MEGSFIHFEIDPDVPMNFVRSGAIADGARNPVKKKIFTANVESIGPLP
jgi:hypothetical protein